MPTEARRGLNIKKAYIERHTPLRVPDKHGRVHAGGGMQYNEMRERVNLRQLDPSRYTTSLVGR